MRPERIRHAAGEFFLIVAGVLVALAAQAWWQNRDNRERAASYTRALTADCARDSALIQQAIAEDSTYLMKGRRLLRMLSSSGPIDEDSLSKELGVSFSEFYPVTGTLETLVNTGDVRLLRSEEIRSSVSQLASEYRGIMSTLDRTSEAAWNTPFVDVLTRHQVRGRRMDMEAFESDPQLRSVAHMSIGIALTRLTALHKLQDDNTAVLKLIRTGEN